ncbi:MAG: ATP-binding protein [Pseudomonadota bacterium]
MHAAAHTDMNAVAPPGLCAECGGVAPLFDIVLGGVTAATLIAMPLWLLVALAVRRKLHRGGLIFIAAASLVCGLLEGIIAVDMVADIGDPARWMHPLFIFTALSMIIAGLACFRRLRHLPTLAELSTANQELSEEVTTRRLAESRLAASNARLESEVAARIHAEEELVAQRDAVEKQVQDRLEDLRESEERRQLALFGSHDGLWDWDIGSGTVRYSDINRELLGLDFESFPDKFESWAGRVHPDDLPSALETVQRHLDTGEPYEIEYRIRAADDTWRWWRSRGMATWDAQKRPIRMLGINRDVTEARLREQDLIKARRDAEASSVAKSAFLATMSHEIRTPMNGIIGMADLLSNTHLTDEQRMQVHTIIRSGEGLLTIINDVLDFSKIEAGQMRLEARPFDIEDEVQTVGLLLGAAAREKGLTFCIEVAPDLPRHVIGDAGRIRQIATNLLGNAIKFTPKGRVGLSLTGKEAHGTVSLSLQVSDTGIGIPLDRQAAVFAAYEQVEGPEQRRGQGTGLGLAITRRIVEAMNGALTLHSEPGRGSTFTCRIALPAADAVEMQTRRPISDGDAVEPKDLTQLSVLVAEDNATNRLLMKKLLGPSVGTLGFAETGREAVERYRAMAPDVILMDVSMPELDGYEATAAIREIEGNEGRARVPIIALTANAMQGDRERCLRAGMDDFLTKPIRRNELTEALSRWRPDPASAVA